MKEDRSNATFPLLFAFNQAVSEEMQLKAITYSILEHQWDRSERAIFRVESLCIHFLGQLLAEAPRSVPQLHPHLVVHEREELAAKGHPRHEQLHHLRNHPAQTTPRLPHQEPQQKLAGPSLPRAGVEHQRELPAQNRHQQPPQKLRPHSRQEETPEVHRRNRTPKSPQRHQVSRNLN